METDFIKYNKQIKLNKIIEILKNPKSRTIPEISILLSEIGLLQIINSDSFIAPGIGFSFIFISSYLLFLEFKCEKIIYNNKCYNDIQKLLRTTETYKELSFSYHDYIMKCNKFFNENSISTPMEIITTYQKMLVNGYLCESGRGGYNLDAVPRSKFDCMFELEELLGCRVATGGYVCRHVTSLLTSIINTNQQLNKKNIKAFYTKAWITDKEEKSVNYTEKHKPNHAILILKENDKYFGYCPTTNSFISIEDYIEKNNSIKIKAYDFANKNIKYTGIISKEYNKFPDLSKEEYNRFFSSNINDNNFNEKNFKRLYLSYLIAIKKLINIDENKFTRFYNNTKDELKSIEENINKMVPISVNKKKIKQLVIK